MKSSRTNKYWRIGVLAAFIVCVFWFFNDNSESYLANGFSGGKTEEAKKIPLGPYVSIGDSNISVEIASTSAAVTKGLSGRVSLEQKSGMLFIFSKPDMYRFWMPEMLFPLDIIWINDGKVVSVSENASADFDPAKPVFYTPARPARYVLEVNAGFAKNNNIQAGDAVTFNNFPE